MNKTLIKTMADRMKKDFVKTYRASTIEHYCGKVLYKYSLFEIRNGKNVRLVKTEKYNKVWMILDK